tara:strand:+ start:331 stop:693 length:363 start_codon:yes stop_codon:yes gene_type:complete
MKAILIDVINQEIKEVIHDDTLESIYKFVDCRAFDIVNIDEENTLYVDDEGLFVEDQLFFEYSGDTGTKVQLAGNSLLLGYNEEGETIPPSLTLSHVKSKVTFLPKGFDISPSFSITEWN